MGFFDTEKGVNEYIKLAEGYDGSEIIKQLQTHISPGSKVLELGMGPGKDLEILLQYFQATGSDNSEIFVNRFLKLHPQADVLVLDAINIKTDRRFDAIYSNKVLQHLSKSEAEQSMTAQHKVLNVGGIAYHALWFGDKCEEFEGLKFQQYTEHSFTEILQGQFEIIDTNIYTEMESNDSICVTLKRVD